MSWAVFVLLKKMVRDMISSLTAEDVGAAPAEHNHDDRYYTQGEIDERFQDIIAGDLPDKVIRKSKLEQAVQDTLDAADAHIAATEDAHPAEAISYGDGSDVGTALRAAERGVVDALEGGLVIEAVLPVDGAEPEQVLTAAGPAVQFSPGAIQSVTFCRRWPFIDEALSLELVLAADLANAGSFVVQVGWQVNGGAVTNVTRTVTPGAHTDLYTADLGEIIPAASLPAGAMVTLTLSRLGADAADTHPGDLLIYHCRLRRG